MEDPVGTPKKRYSTGHSAAAFNGCGGVVYGLGFVGAVIYFIQQRRWAMANLNGNLKSTRLANFYCLQSTT